MNPTTIPSWQRHVVVAASLIVMAVASYLVINWAVGTFRLGARTAAIEKYLVEDSQKVTAYRQAVDKLLGAQTPALAGPPAPAKK